MSNRRKLRGRDWEAEGRAHRIAMGDPALRAAAQSLARAQVEAIRPGLGDQLDAAIAEQRVTTDRINTVLKALAGTPLLPEVEQAGFPDLDRIPARLSDRIQGLALRVISELRSGQRQACPHAVRSPCPMIAAAWESVARCYACHARTAHPDPPDPEAHTCDLCGCYRPGQTMDSASVQYGPLLLVFGSCQECSRQAGIMTT